MKILKESKEYLIKALDNKEFVKFLRKHKCLTKYKYNVLHFNFRDDEWRYNIRNSINNAFAWNRTIQGDEYWYLLNNLWIDSLHITCKLKRK